MSGEDEDAADTTKTRGWITRGIVGIVIATFFSDVGHEMVTAVLPLYLQSIGLGAAALGVMEGVADLLYSLAKLGGGIFGHKVDRKKPVVALGYLVTAIGSGAMGLATTVPMLAGLRAIAWISRGFRSPLRDFLLSDEVKQSHYGRAYGLERTADMLGAMLGPIIAVSLLFFGASVKTIVLCSVGPAFLSALSIVSFTRDRALAATDEKAADGNAIAKPNAKPKTDATLPKRFWWLLGAVVLFGLGDFSRSFLVLIAARAAGGGGGGDGEAAVKGSITAILFYVAHNFVSALVAYPVGRVADRKPKLVVLAFGYAIGVVTNGMLAWNSSSLIWIGGVIIMSGSYIAVEDTIEKAAVSELLPREKRSLGLGILASANAIGDMVSSVMVGLLLSAHHDRLAFAIPACASLLGALWLVVMIVRTRSGPDAANAKAAAM